MPGTEADTGIEEAFAARGGVSLRFSWAVSALALVLIALQDTSLWTSPRLQAEEGTFFFSRAFAGLPVWGWHWFEVGYLDLWPTLSAIGVARLVPLEAAALWMQICAGLAHWLPALFVAFSRSRLFGSRWRKILGVLVVVLAVPMDNLWVSTLASKFFLAVIPVLILVEATEAPARGMRALLRALLLGITTLSSGLPVLMAPAIWWHGIRTREPEVRRLALLSFVLVVGMVAVIAFTKKLGEDNGLSADSRLVVRTPVVIGASLAVDGVLPAVVGRDQAQAWAHEWGAAGTRNGGPTSVIGWASFGAFALLFWLLWRPGAVGLLLGALVLSILGGLTFALGAPVGPVGNGFAGRYFVVPMLLLGWLSLGHWPTRPREWVRPTRLVASAILIAVLVGGVVQYWRVEIEDPARAPWSDEVAQWRVDPSTPLAISPKPWVVHLSRPSDNQAKAEPYRLGAEPAPLQLSCNPPRLGESTELRLRGATPGGNGVVIIRLGEPVPPRAVSTVPGEACVLAEPLTEALRVDFVADERGEWRHPVPLANASFYVQQTWTVQAFQVSPALSVSDGLVVVLGL